MGNIFSPSFGVCFVKKTFFKFAMFLRHAVLEKWLSLQVFGTLLCLIFVIEATISPGMSLQEELSVFALFHTTCRLGQTVGWTDECLDKTLSLLIVYLFCCKWLNLLSLLPVSAYLFLSILAYYINSFILGIDRTTKIQ
jgi:hypothetical protein